MTLSRRVKQQQVSNSSSNKATAIGSTDGGHAAVNWSGGGNIKEPNVLWDISNLTLAAAMFPHKVMHTPQRT